MLRLGERYMGAYYNFLCNLYMLKTFHLEVFKTPDKFRIISVMNKTTRNKQGFFEASIQLLMRGNGRFIFDGECGKAGGVTKKYQKGKYVRPPLAHRHAHPHPDGTVLPLELE